MSLGLTRVGPELRYDLRGKHEVGSQKSGACVSTVSDSGAQQGRWLVRRLRVTHKEKAFRAYQKEAAQVLCSVAVLTVLVEHNGQAPASPKRHLAPGKSDQHGTG